MKHGLSIILILAASLTLQGCGDSFGSFGQPSAPPSLTLPSMTTQEYAASAKKAADRACRYANRAVTNRAEAKANAEISIKAANEATRLAGKAHNAAVQARKNDPTADEGDIAKKAAKDAAKARKCADTIRKAVLNMKPDTVAAATDAPEISAQDLQGD
ncbi:MAG: hypothetical protein QM492_01625 [Rhodobacterales bacterium]